MVNELPKTQMPPAHAAGPRRPSRTQMPVLWRVDIPPSAGPGRRTGPRKPCPRTSRTHGKVGSPRSRATPGGGQRRHPKVHVMPRKRRGRRRRNARTQRPASVTVRRTGTGGATELTTFSWVSPPTAWDATAAQMRTQVKRAERAQKKRSKKRYIARLEDRKEGRRERWRSAYRKPSANPFDNLPGLAGRTETTRVRQPTIPADARRAGGLASRGSATSLTPKLASTILELRRGGASYQEIAREIDRPLATVGHWVRTGRAAAVAVGGRD